MESEKNIASQPHEQNLFFECKIKTNNVEINAPPMKFYRFV